MQAGARARVGEKVRIWLEPDLEEREVVLPTELKRELNVDPQVAPVVRSSSATRCAARLASGLASRRVLNRAASGQRRMAERLMQAMEGEEDPPPVLRAVFQRQPRGQKGVGGADCRPSAVITCWASFIMRRPSARERRGGKAIDDALRAAKRVSAGR